MEKVKPKKHLGQHFLKDLSAAERIVKLLSGHGNYTKVLEIGPGMGVLTQFLIQEPQYETYAIEIDKESVEYLNQHFPTLHGKIVDGDFLKLNLDKDFILADEKHIGIVGNFPYNISSQIFFKVLEHRDKVTEVVCMLQKEVAKRIASKEGNKDYGILSVLLQAFYDIKYEFTVLPGAFNPPPKVDSGIISLKRNNVEKLDCDERLFFNVVKTGFNQRRKMLRNPLKMLGVKFEHPLLDKRAEQLSVADFIELTKAVMEAKNKQTTS